MISATSSDIPKDITNASRLIYLEVILGIINPILLEITTDVDNFSDPTMIVILLFSSTIVSFLGYDIGRGKNWARIVFLIINIHGILMFHTLIPETYYLQPIVGVLSALQTVISGFIIYLLFTRASRNWYKTKNKK